MFRLLRLPEAAVLYLFVTLNSTPRSVVGILYHEGRFFSIAKLPRNPLAEEKRPPAQLSPVKDRPHFRAHSPSLPGRKNSTVD